jgi:protein-disulfide isomerase
MSKTKPILVIVIAIALAASAAAYLSRGSDAKSNPSEAAGSAPPPGGGRIQGPTNAPVTLVEFADYQCPMCKHYSPMIAELLKRYPEKVRFEFHYYPLIQIHRYAMSAALAAEAAGEQGKYWEMHDILFDYQERWANSNNAESEFLTYAVQLGLNSNKFMQDMRAPDIQSRILQDVTRANAAKVQGTPTIFVNGQRIEPLPQTVDALVRVVDDRLRTAK